MDHTYEKKQKEGKARNPLTEEQTRDGDSVYIRNAKQLGEKGDMELKSRCSQIHIQFFNVR